MIKTEVQDSHVRVSVLGLAWVGIRRKINACIIHSMRAKPERRDEDWNETQSAVHAECLRAEAELTTSGWSLSVATARLRRLKIEQIRF